MRNEKGITLVALILIIIVLLILAGISVSLVVSNESDKIEITPNNQTLLNNSISDTETEDDITQPEVDIINDVTDSEETNTIENNIVTDSEETNTIENNI